MAHITKPSVIRVVSLALDSIEFLCKQKDGLGVRELARKLGAGKSTVHRILQTLEGHGLARQIPETERYVITAWLVKLASLIQNNLEFRSVARPFLSALQKYCGEAIFIGVLDGAEVVIVDCIESSEPLRMSADIGFREPAYSTGLGKVLLASLTQQELASFFQNTELKALTVKTLASVELLRSELNRVRLLCFAVDDEETLIGVRCVAAPVRDVSGRVVAAISLSGPSVRLDPGRISSLAQEVRATAESIASQLGFKGGPTLDVARRRSAVRARQRDPNHVESAPDQTLVSSGEREHRVGRQKR